MPRCYAKRNELIETVRRFVELLQTDDPINEAWLDELDDLTYEASQMLGMKAEIIHLDSKPLLDYVNERGGILACQKKAGLDPRAVKWTASTWVNARRNKTITIDTLDRFVVTLFNVHPHAVYGLDFYEGVA